MDEIIFIKICLILGTLFIGLLGVYAMWWVHCGLVYYYLWLGRRYCITHGFTPSRSRGGPEFDDNGNKTEYTAIEFDCMHPEKGRQLVSLVIGIFGVRKVVRIVPFPKEEDMVTSDRPNNFL